MRRAISCCVCVCLGNDDTMILSGDDMDFFSPVKFRFNGTFYWMLHIFQMNSLFFSVESLFYLAIVWLIHSIQFIEYVQFIRLDRLFGLVLLFVTIFFFFFGLVSFCAHFSIIFHSRQRQSILLPAEWPCIFCVHLICLHFFASISFKLVFWF